MNERNDYPYWMALSQLPKWGNEKINRLIIELLHNKKISFQEFFSLNETKLKNEFNLSSNQVVDIGQLKLELPNYSWRKAYWNRVFN